MSVYLIDTEMNLCRLNLKNKHGIYLRINKYPQYSGKKVDNEKAFFVT